MTAAQRVLRSIKVLVFGDPISVLILLLVALVMLSILLIINFINSFGLYLIIAGSYLNAAVEVTKLKYLKARLSYLFIEPLRSERVFGDPKWKSRNFLSFLLSLAALGNMIIEWKAGQIPKPTIAISIGLFFSGAILFIYN